MLKAVRGATTAPANQPEPILTAVRELLAELLRANPISADHLVCAFFSATPDLDAAFPARAARELGWTDVPLFGMQELAVPGAPARCLRVMLLANWPADAAADAARHVYLRDAAALRPDLGGPAPADPSSVTSLPFGGLTYYYLS